MEGMERIVEELKIGRRGLEGLLGDLECMTIVEDEIVSSTMLGSSQLLVTPPLRGMTSVASVGT